LMLINWLQLSMVTHRQYEIKWPLIVKIAT